MEYSKNIESVGIDYKLADMLEARRRTRQAIHDIAKKIQPGMIEEEAIQMARTLLKRRGMLRGWHGTYVRFGSNTIKVSGNPSDPKIVLGENDIFLIDIGPLIGNCEGDGGETFVFGNNPLMHKCAADTKKLFRIVCKHWQSTQATGMQLYEYAAAQAEKLGWVLNLDLSGHRLSDFPHAAYYDGDLASVDIIPSPDLWVLEIHILHPEGSFGAFFEDLLIDENNDSSPPLLM